MTPEPKQPDPKQPAGDAAAALVDVLLLLAELGRSKRREAEQAKQDEVSHVH